MKPKYIFYPDGSLKSRETDKGTEYFNDGKFQEYPAPSLVAKIVYENLSMSNSPRPQRQPVSWILPQIENK